MNDEIIKAPASGVGAPAPMHVEGLDEVLSEHVKAPRLRIVQSQSKGLDVAKTGDFFLESRGRYYGTKVRFIAIGQFNSRVYFEQGTEMPLCTSEDGKTPFGGEAPIDPKGVIAHDCERCYFAVRQKDPANPRGRLAAPCAAQINFLGLVMAPDEKETAAELCVVQFKRSAWDCGRAIISNAQFSARTVKTLWGFVYELTTKMEDGKRGKYAVPYHAVAGLTERLYPKIEDVARGYAGIWSALRARLVRESLVRDEDDFVEVAPEAAAPTAAPGSEGTPKDDLPF